MASSERRDDRASRSEQSTFSERFARLSGVSAGLGAVWFALLSTACSAVYAPLGVSPSEVGLGYSELLSRAAVAAIGLVVLSGLFLLALVPAGWVFARIRPETLGRTGQRWSMAGRATAAMMIIGVLAASLFIRGAIVGARALQDGYRPPPIALGLPAPWRANIVEVSWASPTPRPTMRLPPCLLMLGRTQDTTVFYNVRSDRTLRLPSSLIVIEEEAAVTSSLPGRTYYGITCATPEELQRPRSTR